MAEQGDITRQTGWFGPSQGFFLASHLTKSADAEVVVCATDGEAERLEKETSFFLQLIAPLQRTSFLYPSRPVDLDPVRVESSGTACRRIAALHGLLESGDKIVLFTSLHAWLQFTIPKPELLRLTDLVVTGEESDREKMIARCVAGGYEREALVEEPGTFAVRGAIVDIFPPHLPLPVRIEMDGDLVESIRTFDPRTQKSLEPVSEVILLPCREAAMETESIPAIRRRLKILADEMDIPRNRREPVEDAIQTGRLGSALETLLPVFFDRPGSLADFVPTGAKFTLVDPFTLRHEAQRLASEFDRVGQELTQQGILAAPPSRLAQAPDSGLRELEAKTAIHLSDVDVDTSDLPAKPRSRLLEDLRRALLDRKREDPLGPLLETVRGWQGQGKRVVFVASTSSSYGRLQALLAPRFPDLAVSETPAPALWKKPSSTFLVRGDLSAGFELEDEPLAFVTEHEIFGETRHRLSQPIAREDAISSISELSPGNAIVHLDFGVGLYRELKRMTVSGVTHDFVHLEYAGGDKLYLPVERLNRIQKYVGAEGKPPELDRLGIRSTWAATRERARKAVEEMAEELIQLYATRKVASKSPLDRPDESYFAFETDFPFEETRDQLRAIEEIAADLESERPMDRLVCGDVGFGKTEVALRAAFRVAMNGKQVAVLVPTTVLCQQHYETFFRRMKDYPIQVDFLSRFKPALAQRETVEKIRSGGIDIIIGTHRILSKDIGFRDLGLLIIDEEHRFGVRHKERIRQYRTQVDVITLTATPIPRTLQLSMAGIRDLSVINTPPMDRKSIETFLCRFDDSFIRGAILKELSRKGQVFFVHNRVETIDAMANHLRKLVPEVRIAVAHGQMGERELEDTMLRFLRHESDLLLCTTIIESGLDLPAANTILINRADRFGLAQLYQLRGRVGRSDRAAYAYLLIPGEDLIDADALKRLKALKRFTELGSGLKIALHDLEIRGAGNLLGSAQSGHIAAIGFELYTQLLDREVRKLKGEPVEDDIDPEITCPFPAYLPDDYVPDTGQRLLLYKRIASVRTNAELTAIREELRDRFGPPPPLGENLFRIVEIKLLARQCGAIRVKIGLDSPTIEFTDRAAVHLDRLLGMLKKDKRLSLRPDQKLILDFRDSSDPFEETKKILQGLV